jgi:hypothetical protein
MGVIPGFDCLAIRHLAPQPLDLVEDGPLAPAAYDEEPGEDQDGEDAGRAERPGSEFVERLRHASVFLACGRRKLAHLRRAHARGPWQVGSPPEYDRGVSKPLLAALGILLLVAAAILVIVRSSEPAPAARDITLPPQVERQPGPLPQEPPAPSATRASGAPFPAAGRAREEAAPSADEAEGIWHPEPEATTGPWEAIAPVNSFGALGKIGPALRTALYARSDDVLSGCSGGGNELEPPAEEEGVVAVDQTPVLLLQLETLQGAVQIAGATVEHRGGASQQLLGCALAGLRGTVLTVPEARSGARHVLRFRLAPTASPHPAR